MHWAGLDGLHAPCFDLAGLYVRVDVAEAVSVHTPPLYCCTVIVVRAPSALKPYDRAWQYRPGACVGVVAGSIGPTEVFAVRSTTLAN